MTRGVLVGLLLVLAAAGAACGSDDDTSGATTTGGTTAGTTVATSSAAETTADSTPSTGAPLITAGTDKPTTPDTDGGSTVTYFPEGDIEPGLAPFVGQATTDLAGRLGIAEDQITVHSAVLVVWPNGALGCPEPGMSYTQVLSDGAVIELVANGAVYRYHSGGSRGPFPCDRPLERPPTRP